MLTAVFEIDAPVLPQGMKEIIAMELEKYGGRVRCVSVTEQKSEQVVLDEWRKRRE